MPKVKFSAGGAFGGSIVGDTIGGHFGILVLGIVSRLVTDLSEDEKVAIKAIAGALLSATTACVGALIAGYFKRNREET